MTEFEKQMDEISNLSLHYSANKIIRKMVLISKTFENNERILLFNAIYHIIHNNGKLTGITDLANKILDGEIDLLNND